MLKFVEIKGEDAYAYEYDEDPIQTDNARSSGGQRIVGGKRAEIEKMPFLVGFMFGLRRGGGAKVSPQCTGALITKDWVVSAAHCISPNIINREDIPNCLNQTKEKGEYLMKKGYQTSTLKCEPAEDGCVKIYPINPYGQAYLGLESSSDEESNGLEVIDIEYVIHHKDSYRGGGTYGEFGGYDITLMKLANKTNYTPACIPKRGFVDSGLGRIYGKKGAKIAGYGKFTRERCMTDEYGDYKFHYCSSDSPCDNSTLPPSPPACKKFFNHKDTPNSIPSDVTEVIVSDKDGEHYCYREASPKEGSWGWCNIDLDATDTSNLKEVESWGFCSKDCFLHKEGQPSHPVLRTIEDVHILGNGLCKKFLESSIDNVTVRPEILCVGDMEELKYEHWGQNRANDGYVNLNGSSIAHKMSAYPEQKVDYLIKAVGTCNGDSGGPVFVSQNGKNVVLGVVSGGRGALGKCGGINNPTHYVRVKKLRSWIIKMLGDDAVDLCSFSRKGLDQ
jgi:hypothetical protein